MTWPEDLQSKIDAAKGYDPYNHSPSDWLDKLTIKDLQLMQMFLMRERLDRLVGNK